MFALVKKTCHQYLGKGKWQLIGSKFGIPGADYESVSGVDLQMKGDLESMARNRTSQIRVFLYLR